MAIGDAGVRTGDVWLSDYDVGLALYLGGVERQVPDPVFKGRGSPPLVPYYTLSVPGVPGPTSFGGHVPLLWGNARDVLNPAVLPCVVIVRQDDLDADTARWVGYDVGYRVPTDAAKAAGVVTVTNRDGATSKQGYSEYEFRAGARAYNFKYAV